MIEHKAARASQRARADRNTYTFYDRYDCDVARWLLEPADQDFLRLITRGRLTERTLMSNKHVRRSAEYAWIDALLAHFSEFPDLQRLWITLAWDTGVTWERSPEIDTVSLRNIAGQHLRRCGLEGAGLLEIDTWKEIKGEPGKRMVPHIHFLGWSATGEAIDPNGLGRKLCERRALPNSLGAPSVVVEEVGLSALDFATIGRYMGKAPAYAKNPVPNRGRPGFTLEQVEHAPGSVARLLEVLSHLDIGDVIFSIGSGKKIADHVRQKVTQEFCRSSKGKPAPTREEVAEAWQRIRLINGNKKFGPCTVITRACQRRTERDF